MKRLKGILLSLRPNEVTYSQMYEGKIHMLAKEGTKELPTNYSDPVYWENGIYYKYERTNRLEPSKPTITIGIPIKKLKIAEGLIDGKSKLSHGGIPAADYCLRSFGKYLEDLNEGITNRKRTDKENGRFYIYAPNGKVLKRNCSYFKQSATKYYINSGKQSGSAQSSVKMEWYLNIMIMVQLPDKKLKQTIQMLTKSLPNAVQSFINNFNISEMKQAVLLYHKQQEIREYLRQSEYCVFIADGSILPRENDTDQPMKNARPFSSLNTERIQIGQICGMGIRRGVTVITGGGYSGKSTLLDAISDGIYNHIKGDGREYIITDETAMTISAEDGRSIRNMNISAFIKWIPGNDTKSFSTSHASGSTSQAANIIEAINGDSKLLLIDEDKSATNFMIRDEIMKKLVKHEPIIPFTDRVQELYHDRKVSCILVIGGSSEYLKVCDSILMMKNYNPVDVTREALELTAHTDNQSSKAPAAEPQAVDWSSSDIIAAANFSPYPKGSLSEHFEVSDKGFIEIGDESVDIRHIHNIAGLSQLTAIGLLIRKMENAAKDKLINIGEVVEHYLEQLESGDLDEIYSSYFTNCERWLELPRKYEVLAVIHRMRYL